MSDDQFLQGTWTKLSEVAVKGALYNSRERQPHPKCLQGTRVDLLKYIHGFLDDTEKNRLIWLHGTAGVGKSAVAFTVSDKMKDLKVREGTNVEKRLAGTFFFSRKHTKRCTAGYFFATLVYQLATNFPSIRNDVNWAIRDNPALLDPDTPLCDQMEALFLKPLRKLQLRLRGCPPLSFIVDALDECTSEPEFTDLILSLAQALREPGLPVTHILLTSRSESHISKVFQNDEVRPLVCEIPVRTSGEGGIISLDGADVDNDICTFLRHSFVELGSRHPDFPQPSEVDVAKLATRAGRRFIVASTMMKFIIDDEFSDPRDRLQLMVELTSELSPGTEVYKLYDRILSTCAKPKQAYLHLSIVAALADPLPLSQISKLLGPGLGWDVQTTLIQLRSVMDIPTDTSLPVNIYHSSVRDYASDSSNCGLPEVCDTASPHSLLAYSSLRLLKAIPESTALLDALSELNKHSRAMKPEDPHRLKNSLAFLVRASEPVSVLISMLWLRGERNADMQYWLETVDGRAWLQIWGGQNWLQTGEGLDWLQTDGGRDWLQRWGGRDWLQTWGGLNWLQTCGGRNWLQTDGGLDWLQTDGGLDWLQTDGGIDWLQTDGVLDWLQTEGGLDWLQTWKGLDWLETWGGRDWLQTEGGGGRDWLQTEGGRDWLQTEGGPDWLQRCGGQDWLQTDRGRDWLQTEGGRDWLQTEGGQDWLQTWGGLNWLQTDRGRDWLQTEGGPDWLQTRRGRDWLQTRRGRDWLQTRRGRGWLQTRRGLDWLQTRRGRGWLQTRRGLDWLQTEGGRDWLQTDGGGNWLQTWGGRDWLQRWGGQDWLQTEGGQDWLQTEGGQDWLQTKGGQDWLQTEGGQDWLQTWGGLNWLQTCGGRNWLQTDGGRDWLQTDGGRDWLQTYGGRNWLQTDGGRDWLQTEGGRDWVQRCGGRDWVQRCGGRDWLQTKGGRDWLQAEGGQDWLQTEGGRDWLQTWGRQNWLQTWGGWNWLQTDGGLDWLQTDRGRDWLQTEGGRDWVQTKGGQDWLQRCGGQDWVQTWGGRGWLQTEGGRDWLQTDRGRDWLQTWDGRNWLQTWGGRDWLQAEGGQDWLQTEGGRDWLQDWLQTKGGRDWLQTEGGQNWLQTEGGRNWLQTDGGRDWLQDWLQTQASRGWLQTSCGQDWLQTSHGQVWQSTPAASVWVTIEEFSRTLGAINEYIVINVPLLPAFQVIQQFESLPDFLMFPVFLALGFQHHPTSALPESPPLPDRKIIHAIKSFESFANKAQERSQSVSDALKYACHNWAVHLSLAPHPWDDTLNRTFQAFWNVHIVSWLEMEWCLKGLRSCLVALSEGQKFVKSMA